MSNRWRGEEYENSVRKSNELRKGDRETMNYSPEPTDKRAQFEYLMEAFINNALSRLRVGGAWALVPPHIAATAEGIGLRHLRPEGDPAPRPGPAAGHAPARRIHARAGDSVLRVGGRPQLVSRERQAHPPVARAARAGVGVADKTRRGGAALRSRSAVAQTPAEQWVLE